MNSLSGAARWLYPGLRVKRWVSLGLVGILVFMVGVGIILQTPRPDTVPFTIRLAKAIIDRTHAQISPGALGIGLTLVGVALCLFAFVKLVTSLTSALDPEMEPGGLVDVIYRRRMLSRGRRIVVVGGGTGLSTMLRGLKRYSSNITAIVTVADDGGSSGKLQRQLHILPPGDIRNCLVALADSEPQMTELFQFRFRDSASKEEHASSDAAGNAPRQERGGFGEGLRDHAFGNLLIAAMCAINDGDFEKAVEETSRVLNIRGRVLPSTVTPITLRGEMEDGSILEGESAIAGSPLKIKRISLSTRNACPLDTVINAIREADIIVLGPGSVFTSVIPNLLVSGMPEALHRSSAKKVYVCNVMTQRGETDGFSAYDHVKAIEFHAGKRVFDYILVNTGVPSQEMLEKYSRVGAVLVEPDIDRIKAAGYRPLPGNYISQTDVVRHDADRLAEAIMRLLNS